MGKLIDLTGQRFGRLTVLGRDKECTKATKWLCLCDCGKEKSIRSYVLLIGKTQSCGCLSAEKTSERNFHNLIGQKFSRLTVIKRVDDYISPKGKHRVMYKCLCDCGEYTIVDATNLKSGKIKSCGCYNVDNMKNKIVNIVGNTYGQLTVLKRVENKHSDPQWLCQCSCGNQVVVKGSYLKSGHTKSCGCIKSFGEYNVNNFLSRNEIEYISQMNFEGLTGVGGRNLTYDFYLPKHKIIIECQGRQHYSPVDFFGGESQFEIQQEHDHRKKLFAEINNLKFIEIPYWDFDNIEEILNRELEVV